MNLPLTGALSRQAAMGQLLQDIALDLVGYASLQDLLGEQFDAAIRHQQARLGQLAEAIGMLVDELETRRARRVALATRLTGPQPAMAQVFALLRPGPRARLEADWAALERMVLAAKAAAKRNGDLLAEQFTIMQRVLHGEHRDYEPA
ncbi:flagella synthesis protein FlgN [Pseudoduganella lurida]|uniref:Flagella synthesis protein FlgN n=1 Tax=Pseudoduganella lurida TaxID=1036180 RepID=A0A562REW7_9BURK|nr:flagellar export chaperone FlgN [Pseudoduganella lurida]TWI67602.1 flagella synthesis protein FlgN [Pseudoduganella lurida]